MTKPADSLKDRMSLWRSEQNTPADKTSKVSRRGGFTAINQQYQLERGTKLWGPYGAAWGMDVVKHELIDTDASKVIVMEVCFFYPHPDTGERCEFTLVNDWPYKAGDDSYKKCQTNCRSKCMSYLGFSADVYSGLHDDATYLKEEKIRKQPSILETQIQKLLVSGTAESIAKCRNWTEKALEQGTITQDYASRFEDACATREKQISNSKNK
jgi:hypothetical protein